MNETKHRGWIGVDLDGTLAKYAGWNGGEIGEPVPAMLERVKAWLAEGQPVKILTARVSALYTASTPERVQEADEQRARIERWCEEHVGQALPVTAVKDFAMVALWDDRAVAVEVDTGRVLNEATIEIAYNMEILEGLSPEEIPAASLVSSDGWPTPLALMPSMHLVRDAIRGGATVVKAGGR